MKSLFITSTLLLLSGCSRTSFGRNLARCPSPHAADQTVDADIGAFACPFSSTFLSFGQFQINSAVCRAKATDSTDWPLLAVSKKSKQHTPPSAPSIFIRKSAVCGRLTSCSMNVINSMQMRAGRVNGPTGTSAPVNSRPSGANRSALHWLRRVPKRRAFHTAVSRTRTYQLATKKRRRRRWNIPSTR
jgi:hypothetical protein